MYLENFWKYFFFLLPLHRLLYRLTFPNVSAIFGRSPLKLRLCLQLISAETFSSLLLLHWKSHPLIIGDTIFYFSPMLAAASAVQTTNFRRWFPYLDEFSTFQNFPLSTFFRRRHRKSFRLTQLTYRLLKQLTPSDDLNT